MTSLTAEFQVTTPVFLGESNGRGGVIEPASSRPPSVKGALRFWWRALHWKDCWRLFPTDFSAALRLLHQREAALFGLATDGFAGGGQGCYLMSVEVLESNWNYKRASVGQAYLLGQGLFRPDDNYGIFLRQPSSTSRFSLKLVFKPRTPLQDVKQVASAVLLWGTLGGLGSRCRKGFGSISIQQMHIEMKGQSISADQVPAVPENCSDLGNLLRNLFSGSLPPLPPFTAVSDLTRCDLAMQGGVSMEILDRLGLGLQRYRSYGLNNQVNRQPALRLFAADHDLVLNILHGNTISTLPQRAIFGLPHNYYFSSYAQAKTQRLLDDGRPLREAKEEANKLSKVQIAPTQKTRDRRASPLFFHVHQFPSGECILIASVLPATFLPMTDDVTAASKISKSIITPSLNGWNVQWSAIHHFLDRLDGEKIIG